MHLGFDATRKHDMSNEQQLELKLASHGFAGAAAAGPELLAAKWSRGSW